MRVDDGDVIVATHRIPRDEIESEEKETLGSTTTVLSDDVAFDDETEV